MFSLKKKGSPVNIAPACAGSRECFPLAFKFKLLNMAAKNTENSLPRNNFHMKPFYGHFPPSNLSRTMSKKKTVGGYQLCFHSSIILWVH
jgi:hypothetical protein